LGGAKVVVGSEQVGLIHFPTQQKGFAAPLSQQNGYDVSGAPFKQRGAGVVVVGSEHVGLIHSPKQQYSFFALFSQQYG
jgi:hypothetical protein